MENKINKFLEELIQEIETELDEATASGAAGAYSTPSAFSDNGSKDKNKKKKIATQLGMKLVGKVNERINPKFYDARVQYIDPKSKKKFVGDVVRYDNGQYKVNLGKDGRFERYILAKEKDLKIVSKSKKRTYESVNEGKYNYKADALTAYFKGKIDAKELDKIARDDFKSGIATKKELSNFLSNKFTQDVMSDTYGIPTGTLIKRVRGLMKFAESIGESKKEVIAFRKKAKSETAFYDILDKIERKYGRGVFEKWLDKSLKDLKLNPKKYKTSADKQEALFQAKL